jgi:uncharacterized protein
VTLIGLLGFATVVLVAMFLLHGYLWWGGGGRRTKPRKGRQGLAARDAPARV